MQGAAAVEKMGPALFAIRFQKKNNENTIYQGFGGGPSQV